MTAVSFPTTQTLDADIPREHSAIVEAAVAGLVPCLIFGTVLVQQEWAFAHDLGQVLLWMAILAAAEIVYVLLRAPQVLAVVGVLIVGLRAASAALGASGTITATYEMVNSLLFALAGVAVVRWRGDVLERQLRTFFIVTVPFMLAQLVGWPAWTQAWRTDAHGDESMRRVMVRTLFEREGVEGFPSLQARPAGVLHANNFLSIVMLFAMAFLFDRSRGGKLRSVEVAFMIVLVLTMAKVLYIGFLVFTVLYLVRGPRSRRVWLGKMWGVLLLAMGTYYLLFPGVFLFDLSPNNALLNYAIRMADLRAVLGGLDFADVTVEGFGGITLELAGIPAGSQSAIAAAARHFVLLTMVVPVVFIAYFHALASLRRRNPELTGLAVNGAVMLGLALLITSFVGNPFFGFTASLVLLPWLVPLSGRTQ